MSTANKLTYLNDTKQLLKQKINNLGGDITDNTTFRQYAEELQTIYNNAPKTDYAEGSNITLSNCLKGKLDYEDDKVGYGDTKQESTNGYNLLNLPYYEITQNGVKLTINDGVITLNGNSTNYTTIIIPNSALQSLNGNYNINFEYVSGSVSQYANINLYDNQGSQQVKELTFQNSNSNSNFSASNVSPVVRIYWNNNSVFSNYIIKPMLYTGNYDSSKSWEPYSGGYASPSPNWEQEVKCVRGKNKLNLENCTKLGNATRTNETSNSVELTGIGAWSNGAYIFPNFAKNTNFRISLKLKSSVARTTGITISGTNTNDTSSLTTIIENTSSLTANIEKEYSVIFNSGNYKYICMRIWTNYSTTTLDRAILEATEIMLVEGSQATSYLPYNTQEVVVRGKNLSTINSISTTGGGYINYSVSQLANVTKGETYTLSIKNNTSSTSNLNVRITSGGTYSTEAQGNLVANGVKTYTFTASQSGILNLNSYLGTEDITNALTEIQLEEGSSATTYEPYITPITKTLNLGDIELAKIGNYRDYIWTDRETGKWYKHSAIIKRTLNGTESINIDNSYIASGRFNINQYTDAKYGSQATPNIMSNYYRPNFAIENGSIFVSGVSPDICIIDTRYQNNLNGFKQYLSENTPIIYYVLATATDTEITDTTLLEQLEDIYNIMSLNGTTIVEINGNLPMIMKVRALKNG